MVFDKFQMLMIYRNMQRNTIQLKRNTDSLILDKNN